MREKTGRNRYIVFEVSANREIAPGEFVAAVKSVARGLSVAVKPWLVLFSKNKGILRCSHRHKDDAVHLLLSINSLRGESISIRTLGTTGTVKSAIRKYFGGACGRRT